MKKTIALMLALLMLCTASVALAEEAVKAALKDYFDRNGIPYDPAQFPEAPSCASCEMH